MNKESFNSEEVKDKILNARGTYVKAAWRSNPSPAAAFKHHQLEKRTVAVIRAGINFANLSIVKQGIENEDRGPVQELPWGVWKKFPYIIEHKGQEYLRITRSQKPEHKAICTYFVDGEIVDKVTFSTYLTKSAAAELMKGNDSLVFNIKIENVLGIPEEIDEK